MNTVFDIEEDETDALTDNLMNIIANLQLEIFNLETDKKSLLERIYGAEKIVFSSSRTR